jgi:hypothetical protein
MAVISTYVSGDRDVAIIRDCTTWSAPPEYTRAPPWPGRVRVRCCCLPVPASGLQRQPSSFHSARRLAQVVAPPAVSALRQQRGVGWGSRRIWGGGPYGGTDRRPSIRPTAASGRVAVAAGPVRW